MPSFTRAELESFRGAEAPDLLGACDNAREGMGVPRDQRQEHEIADARVTTKRMLTPTEWRVIRGVCSCRVRPGGRGSCGAG